MNTRVPTRFNRIMVAPAQHPHHTFHALFCNFKGTRWYPGKECWVLGIGEAGRIGVATAVSLCNTPWACQCSATPTLMLPVQPRFFVATASLLDITEHKTSTSTRKQLHYYNQSSAQPPQIRDHIGPTTAPQHERPNKVKAAHSVRGLPLIRVKHTTAIQRLRQPLSMAATHALLLAARGAHAAASLQDPHKVTSRTTGADSASITPSKHNTIH